MVLLRAETPPPPRPWEDAPEVEYRLHKDPINMARAYDSTIVTIKRLILRESANEPDGTQFVTDEDDIHKIPQLPISKHKYFIVVMYPPEDLDSDDTPMDSDKPVKFLFSFYNLYLIGFSYDEIWNVFNDAMIVGVSQESRVKYVKELAFPGDYNSIGQNYLKLDIGFNGQCDTYNRIVGIQTKKTNEDQLIRVLCRTTITLPESSRFAFLSQFHLINFHTGNFDVVLDKEVVEGEEYKNFSLHFTKWGTYSSMSKDGRQSFKVSAIPASGIKSYSELLSFISVATNKIFDDENKQLVGEVVKAQNTGDDHADDKGADDKGGNKGQNNDNQEDSNENKKNVQGNDKTWFYQAPVMPYVPYKRQNLYLDNEADVATFAVLEFNRKARLEEISWMLLLQLAMLEACKYAEEKLSVKVDKLGKDSLINCAKTSMSSKLIHTDHDFFANMVVEAVRAVKTTKSNGEVKYPVKSINILKVHGKSDKESFLHNGSHAAQGMPTLVHPAGVACLEFNLQKRKLQLGVQVLVSDPRKPEKIRERESNIRKELTEKVPNAGANVVFTTKGIDDMSLKVAAGGDAVEADALYVYLENQVVALGSIERLAIAELAESSPKVATFAGMEGEETFGPSFLGHSDEVVEKRISDDDIILVEDTKKTSVVSMVLRGANDFILEEIEPSLHDAMCIVKRSLDSSMVATGGGAVEAGALYVYLENQAAALGSMERLAIAELAESSAKVHDELTLEGPWESSDMDKATLAERMSHALCGPSILAAANLDAKCAQNWYAGRGHGDSENHDRYPLGILGVIA